MNNLLIFLIFYLPFQLALNPSEGIDLASIRILILGIFFLWLAQGLRKKHIFIKKNMQTGLIIAFLFINSISLVVAKNTDWSIRKLLFLFSIFPIYFVGAYLFNNEEKILKAAKALVLSGTLVALLGLVQFLAQFLIGMEKVYNFWANYIAVPFLGKSFSQAVLQNPSWLVNISGKTFLRATATFPDPHMFSFFLGMLIPFAFALMFLTERKILYGIASALLLLTDATTFSRGGYLGLFAGALMVMIPFWNKAKNTQKITAGIIVVFFALMLIIPNPVSNRYFSSFNLKEGSNKGRIETWGRAEKIIFDNPAIGVGIGNYPLEIKSAANYREPIYAHNTYLDIAAETGIFNALIFIGILFAAIQSFLKKSKENIIFLAGAASLVIFSIHSLVETAIYSPVVLTLLLLIISFSSLEEKYEKVV